MALSSSTLEANLASFMGNNRSLSEGASELASQYDSYAQDAVDVTGDSPDSLNKGAMANTLESGWSIGLSYSESAEVIEKSIQDYWNNGTFQLNYPPTGAVEENEAIVTAVPPTGSIKTNLADAMSKGSGEDGESSSIMASLWATPIHSGTLETVVKCTGVDSNGNTVTEEGPIS